MSITRTFMNAEVSEASYADFRVALQPDGSYRTSDVIVALKNIGGTDKGFSQTQAADFVKHWRVASHQPDMASGFSATLFESLDNPGTYTLAIRGTTNAADLSTDIWGIGALGVARDQTYDLYNYFQRLITPASENVGQWVKTGDTDTINGVSVPHYSYQTAAAAGLGVIVDATGLNTNFNAALTVAGHSLGGHLGLAFSRLFPNWTQGLFTYNAPGIAATSVVDIQGIWCKSSPILGIFGINKAAGNFA